MVHKKVKAELKVPAFFRCLNNYVTSIQSRGLAESTGRNSRWALLKARLAEYAHEMGSPEACNDQLAGLWIIKSLVKNSRFDHSCILAFHHTWHWESR